MEMSEQSAPPHVRLIQMATGFFLSGLLYTAANLGIADHLANGPKSAEELSGPTGCNARSLYRFLRTLTNFGILTLGADARVVPTASNASIVEAELA
jgi:Dimerisation domain